MTLDQPELPNQVDLKIKFDELELHARLQGTRGTCVFFSVAALANYEYARSTGKPQEPFSEEHLVWAARNAMGRRYRLRTLGTFAPDYGRVVFHVDG
jgi:hypothetical protein